MLYACDHTWWDAHFAHVATACSGELWTVSESAREVYDLNWIYGCDHAGLSPSTDYIHTGKNSGYQAIGLAHAFGARALVLLGFDFMLGANKERHWHADHPKGLTNSAPQRFASWAQQMDVLAVGLKLAGVKVLNASRRTALRSFPRVTLETALHEIRNPGGS